MKNFLATKDISQSNLVVLGAPLEAAKTFRGGVSRAPDEIRKASHSIESYSPFFNSDLKDLAVSDLGNLSLSKKSDEALNLIEKTVSNLVGEKKRFLVIGGEHTISLGVIRGIYKRLGGAFQIVVFDAHSDFRDTWQGGKINHATVIRRIYELNKKLNVAGTRSFYGPEDYFQSIYTELEEVKKKLKKELPVYLSVDMDVLDAGIAPGVTNPEPGGLSYTQLMDFIHYLKEFSVLGMDVVEVSPQFDPAQITSITAAKIIVEGLLTMSQTWKVRR